jgi:hypothetical protein
MKKGSIILVILLITTCFLIVFYFAFDVTRKTNREVQKIHTSTEETIGKYFNDSDTSIVTYPANPLFYDKNECVLVCFALTEISGVKYRTQFNILLSRENWIWKANIVKVKRKRYVSPEKSQAPWDFLLKPNQKDGHPK